MLVTFFAIKYQNQKKTYRRMYLPNEKEDLYCSNGLVIIDIVAAAGLFHEECPIRNVPI